MDLAQAAAVATIVLAGTATGHAAIEPVSALVAALAAGEAAPVSAVITLGVAVEAVVVAGEIDHRANTVEVTPNGN
jgi:hypothetical protein